MLVYPVCTGIFFTPHSSTVACFLSFVNLSIRGPVCPAQHLSTCGKELGPFSHVLERGEGCSHVSVLTLSLSISVLSWFLKELVSSCFLLLSLLTLSWLSLVLTLPVLPAHVTFSNHGSLHFLFGFLSVELDGTLLQ